MTPQELIQELVRRASETHAAQVERACEEALQGGEHGVVAWGPWIKDRPIKGRGYEAQVEWVFGAKVSPLVPYGQILYMQNQAALGQFIYEEAL